MKSLPIVGRFKTFAAVCLAILAVSCSGSLFADDAIADRFAASFEHGAVAADHPLASEAGAQMLRQGGNAVDAAVATSFALSVVRPASCGIGGGGFMVIWKAKEQKVYALDYREIAPAAATPEMFIEAPMSSRRGAKAVAIPGTVAGLCQALKEHGTLDLATVLAPAIRLAREGYAIDEHDLAIQAETLKTLGQRDEEYAALYHRYLNAGKTWKLGEKFYSSQLPALEAIAKDGPQAFYEGTIAREMVSWMKEHGGIITAQDLANYKPRPRTPLQLDWRGGKVYTMPPPSSGGICLLQVLQILDAYGEKHPAQSLKGLGHNTPQGLHLLTEAMKHAYADRAEFLGDTDFVQVPVEKLLSREHARDLASRIDLTKTFPPENYGKFAPLNDAGTSHLSVIDREGNAVACTETINLTYGSYVVLPESGIILNNEMDDFAAVPGKPNAFGLLQSASNEVQPGKKPLSSMTPTLFIKDGQVQVAVGASGGPRIISSTIQVFLNSTEHQLDPAAAVASPRIHHQWMPNTLVIETKLEDLAEELAAFGHEISQRSSLAITQLVTRKNGKLWAVSDPRKHGQPAGH
ncbi:Gamma-glutamyltranspeptidase precursor [Planctopirus ephydatiae]|uniref:Gamma-glutamyltranspeptidase n=1 Tax=Planctopirus ephydatiae TaxID=2528019 RepID=A0A518GTS3_9PLAN|nr:gamma-glutamyltransferase [Planctopirus ephydatiae]QDV31987.1 Gamma-glutamyltranspeptidase precursor [Planctopirus ephydatiae]